MSKSSDTPGPTAEEKALAKRGAREWNRYVQDILPASDVAERGIRATGDDRATLRREISATANEGSAQGVAQLSRQTPMAGGQAAMALQEDANQRTRGVVEGVNESERALLDRETRGLMSLAAQGRGMASSGMQSLAQAGSDSLSLAAQESKNDAALAQGLTSAALTVGGTYLGQRAPSGGSTGLSRTVINAPDASAYHNNGGYRGSGF